MGTMKPLSPLPKLFDLDFYLKNALFRKQRAKIRMKQDPGNRSDPLQKVFDYHKATKHYFQRYASGPGYLDWNTQPNPFRRYEGARVIHLEKPRRLMNRCTTMLLFRAGSPPLR